MSLEQLTEFFQWMTIINVGFLVLSTVLYIALKKVMGQKHGKLFGIPEEKVAEVTYGYFGIYRVLVIVFNLVPYLALLLIN